LNIVSDTESGIESADWQRVDMQSADSQATDSQATGRSEESNALLSRLRVIEDQPLESRAVAFAQIHEELQARLDSGDVAAHVD
jgi:hypothetical protein